jgi:hypothetical protein
VPYQGLFAAGLGGNQELFIGEEMEAVIKNARDDGTFGMYSLEQTVKKPVTVGQIYVHSKILIVDDCWALIGSANAGGISLEGIRWRDFSKDRFMRKSPDTELSAVILDKQFASKFRQTLWEEHLQRKVDAAYRVEDADQFRRVAGQSAKDRRVRFFPDYNKIKRGAATWWITPNVKDVSIEPYRDQSTLVAGFDDRFRYNLPVAMFPAVFRARVFPPPPVGYRVWYRWKCDLYYNTGTGEAEDRTVKFRMRSVEGDEDDVWEYSHHSAAYIGKKTAAEIDRRVSEVATGRVVCRVQLVPLDEGPDELNEQFPTLLLTYDCEFMNAKFARSNLDPGLLRLAKDAAP